VQGQNKHGGTRTEEAGREVPPAQDGALPHRPIPEVDEELEHGRVRVVSVQDADEGTPVQELRQVEAATEDNVGRDTEKDRKREEPVRNQGTVCGRAVHWSDLGLLENDEGGGEGGAAGAATRTNGGEGGRGYAVSLVTLFCPSLSFRQSFFFSLSSLSFFLSLFFSFLGGQAGRGQGESPRAAGGLLEGAADGEQERIVYRHDPIGSHTINESSSPSCVQGRRGVQMRPAMGSSGRGPPWLARQVYA